MFDELYYSDYQGRLGTPWIITNAFVSFQFDKNSMSYDITGYEAKNWSLLRKLRPIKNELPENIVLNYIKHWNIHLNTN